MWRVICSIYSYLIVDINYIYKIISTATSRLVFRELSGGQCG